MRSLLLISIAVLCCNEILLADDLDEKIKQRKHEIEVATALVQSRTKNMLSSTGSAEFDLNESLLEELFAQVQSLPPTSRSVDVKLTDIQGPLWGDWSDQNFICGSEIGVDGKRYGASGTIDFTNVQWLGGGTGKITARINLNAYAQLLFYLHAVPSPKFHAEIAQADYCVGIGKARVCVKVPYPVVEFLGWNKCGEAPLILGNWRFASLGVTGRVNQPETLTVQVADFGALPKKIAVLLLTNPSLTPPQIASLLNVSVADVNKALDQLRDTGIVDKGTGQLTPRGEDFGRDISHWLYVVATPDDPHLHMNFFTTIPLPNPFYLYRDLFCDVLYDILKPWCDLTDKLKGLFPPVEKFLAPLEVPVEVDKDHDIPNPLFSSALPVRLRETIVVDPPKDSSKLKVLENPFLGRPVTVAADSMTIQTPSPGGLRIPAEADIGWSDLMAYSNDLQVHFIDVGQGDAIWIHTPPQVDGTGRKNVVIDGGPTADSPDIAGYGNRFGLYLTHAGLAKGSVIDLLILTHPHVDHFTGLSDIVKNYRILKFFVPKYCRGDIGYQAFRKLALLAGAEELAGEEPILAELGTGITGQVLYSYRPSAPLGHGRERASNASIVIRLAYGKYSFLFMGDALGHDRNPEQTAFVEHFLLSEHKDLLLSTVLKVADHASSRSTSNQFLDAVQPAVLVVMAGPKKVAGEWLPNEAALHRLVHRVPNATVVRTDFQERQASHGQETEDVDDIFVATDGVELATYQGRMVGGVRSWVQVRVLP